MAKNLSQIYSEKYYQVRAYEFEERYPWFLLMSYILVSGLRPKRSLDIGCAKGYLVYALRERGMDAYGIDVSDYALSHSPDGIKGCLVLANAERALPFRDKTFDLLTSFECMEHLEDPSRAVAEMARILEPGGYVVMGVPKITVWRRLFTLVFGKAEVHPSELTRGEWVEIFNRHNLVYAGDFRRLHMSGLNGCLRALMVRHTYKMIPCLPIGRFLNRLGKPGRWLRVQLNLVAWQSEYFLFRAQEFE